MQVNILEAKNRLSELVKSAQAGKEVVIANRGQPVVKLVRLEPCADGSRPHADKRNILDWLRQHPLPVHAGRSAERIDAALADERSAWD